MLLKPLRARTSTGVLMVLALLFGACSGDDSSGSESTTTTTPGKGGNLPPVNQPGVTATEIHVSGVASTTNPTGNRYGSSFDGVQAYFDMINSEGGIYGRKLVIDKRRDDQLGNNRREVLAIIESDKPFAVLPVTTIIFSGADLLAKSGIPTFGWNIQDEWTGPPNLFGQVGALCIGGACGSVPLPWVASKLRKTRIGVLAYNVSQSANCTDGIKASFAKYPTAKIVFLDKSLAFGVTDFSTDVKKMREANVDLVTSCMDSNGVLGIAKEMRQQGMQAIHYMPNAYEHDFMAKNGSFFEGSIVSTLIAPIETKPRFPGLKQYIEWMDKAGYQKTENAEVGWANAAQFVSGLRDAGPDFTQQKVIEAINRQTAFNADGIVGPIDWTRKHTEKGIPPCIAYLRVHNSQFVPEFSPPGKPFTCFLTPANDVESVKPTFR
jgi:ABC-type branched-subunit amino acid transport system substrate-binding protein